MPSTLYLAVHLITECPPEESADFMLPDVTDDVSSAAGEEVFVRERVLSSTPSTVSYVIEISVASDLPKNMLPVVSISDLSEPFTSFPLST